ncbi:MAG: TIGR02281 family clan AA aspartic protease [Halioglobus sp.]
MERRSRLDSFWVVLAFFAASAIFLSSPSAFAVQASSIAVEALFPNAAVLKVQGQRKMLKAGQTHKGVTLVSAGSTSVVVEIEGKRHTLGLSRHVGSAFEEVEAQSIALNRDKRNQYQTNILINGRSVLALVDTGATTVAMSGTQARALGIEYYGGTKGQVSTASGLADAYSITLRSVSVGGIEVGSVRASVVEGDYPDIVLLGMTYLRHVKMEEQGGVLTLSRTR